MPILLLLLINILRVSASLAISNYNKINFDNPESSDRKESWTEKESLNYGEEGADYHEYEYNTNSYDYDPKINYVESSVDSRISDENIKLNFERFSFFEDEYYEEYEESDDLIDDNESKVTIDNDLTVSILKPRTDGSKRFSCYCCNIC